MTFHLIWESRIDVYKLSSNKRSFTFVQTLACPDEKSFFDVYYESKNYYALMEDYLVVFRLNQKVSAFESVKIKL